MSESAENLDSLFMGEGSESASESNEQFSERLKVAQQKIAQVKKDEKKSKQFDDKLAQIIPFISSGLLEIVIFLIDEEVPSLTILAVLSLVNEKAEKICFEEFYKHIAERADFSAAELPKEIEERISYWQTFIFGADHISKTVRFAHLKKNLEFVKRFTHYSGMILRAFLKDKNIHKFEEPALEEALKKYEIKLFSDEA